MATICLRRRLPGASSDRYPRARRATVNALLFGLAPGGVCLAGRSPGRRWALTPPFHPYLAARLRRHALPGGLISVALSFGLPRLGVTQRPALWSPDFPPTLFTSPAVTCPPRPGVSLPADIRKHAPGADRQEPAVRHLEKAMDQVSDQAFGLAIHRNVNDTASPAPRLHLHPPRAAGLGRVRVLHRGRDDRLLPFIPLDRPDAQAVGALADLRPPLSPLEHPEGRRQVRPQLRASRSELSPRLPDD